MTYEAWEKNVPATIREDSLWKMEAYKLSLFLAEIGRTDAAKLLRNQLGRSIADQLYRAVSNISSNVAEGYSRSTGRDRARFYEYALGSARESRDWYFKSRSTLGEKVATHRLELTTQIVRILIRMAANERKRNVSLIEGAAMSITNHQSPA